MYTIGEQVETEEQDTPTIKCKRHPPDPFKEGRYIYLDQLETMESCIPDGRRGQMRPEKFTKITTPLKMEEWEVELRELPDRRCADV